MSKIKEKIDANNEFLRSVINLKDNFFTEFQTLSIIRMSESIFKMQEVYEEDKERWDVYLNSIDDVYGTNLKNQKGEK